MISDKVHLGQATPFKACSKKITFGLKSSLINYYIIQLQCMSIMPRVCQNRDFFQHCLSLTCRQHSSRHKCTCRCLRETRNGSRERTGSPGQMGFVSSPGIQNTKYKIQNTKYKIQNTKYKIQNTKHHHLDVAGLAILPPAPGGAEDARGQESDVSCLP